MKTNIVVFLIILCDNILDAQTFDETKKRLSNVMQKLNSTLV